MTMLLLTTSMFEGQPSAALRKMLAGIGQAVEAGLAVRLLLLLQKTTDADARSAHDWPGFVTLLTRPDMMSLSSARNILLAEARQLALLDQASVVAFPDDDSWYPSGFPQQLETTFAERPELDFAFSRYASSAAPVQNPPQRPAVASDVVQNASSNTIFLRGSLAASIGDFDPALGVGTPNNGGEDLEYGLRAYRAARQSLFFDAALVGHRDKNSGLRAKYYRGSLMSLRRHSADPGIRLQYLRKIAVGFALVLRGELQPGDLIKAIGSRPAALPGATLVPQMDKN